MSGWAPRVFWSRVDVVRETGGFGVTLDDRPLRTPAKAPLLVPTGELADAVAAEWRAQQDTVDPRTMPFTRTANSAVDKVAVQRAEIVSMLAEYGDSDLLCYRADHPVDLVDRQAQAWDPLLDWAADRFGARLVPRTGIMHAPQDKRALDRLAAPMAAMDAFRLAAFHDLVALSGSLVLGLAVADGAHPPDHVWSLSCLDEAWQAEQWGVDDEAQAAADAKRAAFRHAARFLVLCGPADPG